MTNSDHLKQLRNETGVSITLCKEALEEGKGNIEKAKEILRKRGQEIVKKRAHRSTNAGTIYSYIHPNAQIGVLLEASCETDFVSRSESYKMLLKELALQITATSPLFVSEKDITEDFINKEREIYQAQMDKLKKPKEIMNKIIDGKIEKYKKEVVLLSQQWVKDSSKTIRNLVDETIAKTGENIEIKRFTRYEVHN